MGKRLRGRFQCTVSGQVARPGDIHFTARGPDPDQGLAAPLRHGTGPQRLGLPSTGTATILSPSRPNGGAKRSWTAGLAAKSYPALTFRLDQSIAADHRDEADVALLQEARCSLEDQGHRSGVPESRKARSRLRDRDDGCTGVGLSGAYTKTFAGDHNLGITPGTSASRFGFGRMGPKPVTSISVCQSVLGSLHQRSGDRWRRTCPRGYALNIYGVHVRSAEAGVEPESGPTGQNRVSQWMSDGGIDSITPSHPERGEFDRGWQPELSGVQQCCRHY